MSKIKSAEELREAISKEFFSYEDAYIKKGIDNIMKNVDSYLKAKLESITDEVIEEMANEIPMFPPLRLAIEHRNKWIQGAKRLKQKLLKDE